MLNKKSSFIRRPLSKVLLMGVKEQAALFLQDELKTLPIVWPNSFSENPTSNRLSHQLPRLLLHKQTVAAEPGRRSAVQSPSPMTSTLCRFLSLSKNPCISDCCLLLLQPQFESKCGLRESETGGEGSTEQLGLFQLAESKSSLLLCVLRKSFPPLACEKNVQTNYYVTVEGEVGQVFVKR